MSPVYEPDWGGVLDDLKKLEGLDTDTQLAEILGVTRGYVSLIRQGKKGLSFRLTKFIFSRLGEGYDYKNVERFMMIEAIATRSYNDTKLNKLVIDRARGQCELCSSLAPFRDKNGDPYLRTWWLNPTRESKQYVPKNLLALCPNCHDKMRINPDSEDVTKLKEVAKKHDEI